MKLRNFTLSLLFAVAAICTANTPKYIFYFIGDGMGMGAVSAAQAYNRTVLGNEKPLIMMQFPIASAAYTHSANSPVTDSAAAGTALSTGYKTNNGMLGMTPDTVGVVSMAHILKNAGYGIGLVTTVAPDDATPAAFYAQVPKRSMFYEIGKQAASSGFDFIAGANLRGCKGRDGKPNDLLDIFEQNEVSVVRGIPALKEAKYKKVLLLNTDSTRMNNVGHAIDSLDNVLTLPQMTQACIDHLLANTPERFFMMVEGGTIDHAGHANDAATSIMETINFNQALQIAYDFYLAHPDETLIVVTADHETGGMALASRRLHYDTALENLKHQKISKDMFSEMTRSMLKDRRNYEWADMEEILKDKLGLYSFITVSDKDNEILREKFEKTFALRNSEDNKTMYQSFNEFVETVFNLLSSMSGVGWTSSDHSGAVVPVYAVGVEDSFFSPMQDNTEIPGKILHIAGVGQ